MDYLIGLLSVNLHADKILKDLIVLGEGAGDLQIIFWFEADGVGLRRNQISDSTNWN